MTIEEFRNVFVRSKLNVKQFGNHLGISNAMVSYLLNGRRQITKEISNKAKELGQHVVNKTDPS